jgi:hypothetical protein
MYISVIQEYFQPMEIVFSKGTHRKSSLRIQGIENLKENLSSLLKQTMVHRHHLGTKARYQTH